VIYWGSNSIFVTVQPSASLLRNPANLKWIYAFSRTLQQVQSPGLNCCLFSLRAVQ